MSAPEFTEELFRLEVDHLDAWRNRLRLLAVQPPTAEYDDETGEPLNRAAEVESVLQIALDETGQTLAMLRRVEHS